MPQKQLWPIEAWTPQDPCAMVCGTNLKHLKDLLCLGARYHSSPSEVLWNPRLDGSELFWWYILWLISVSVSLCLYVCVYIMYMCVYIFRKPSNSPVLGGWQCPSGPTEAKQGLCTVSGDHCLYAAQHFIQRRHNIRQADHPVDHWWSTIWRRFPLNSGIQPQYKKELCNAKKRNMTWKKLT